MRYLLDTDVLSEPAKAQPDPYVIGRLRREAPACATSAVVWMELSYGVLLLPRGRRRSRLRAFVEGIGKTFPILSFDAEAALWLAAARARQQKAGISRPKYDGIIAATAASRGLTLVTGNPRDFEGFPGLRVEVWRV